ncbi:hypothetical protein [Pyxidicoccus caerfyrddinensis]|uniref:hypothetical protein n=1 Tax=Pyxidicoccus caerfyrddinensis TaxID=2709663 RepID=UPI0013DBE4BF|nr:hypothetical protein [Pyxidicoccus caerfyrddinensis]
MKHATPGVVAPPYVVPLPCPDAVPTCSPAGTYRVDTRVYTADGSQTLRYRNDTTFTANRGVSPCLPP